MALDSRRRNRGFPDSTGHARRGLRLALLASCLVSSTAIAQAQETVVIGGGPAPSGNYAAPDLAPIGEPGSGIQVNDSVLDSLGAGPAGAVPMAAPQMPVYGAGMASPGGSAGSAPSGAYRLPGTGELVVTRPSTLLYPPMEAPHSRLALTPPSHAASQQAMQNAQQGTNPAPAMSGGKLKSRLIAEPPKQPLAAPTQAVEAPMEPMPAPQPKAAAPAPAMPSLTEPAQSAAAPTQSASTTSSQQPPAPPVAASIAPAPQQEAPKAPSVPAPSVPAPSVAAPSIPKAPAPAPVATPTAPPAAPSSLTAAQSAPSPSAATPPAKPMQSAALTEGTATGTTSAGDVRLSFAEGSAELSDGAKQSLLGLAKSLAQDTSSRVQLLAYAADGGEGTSRARRLSLSRALAVRAFLIDQGVRSTRMDVRALGSNAGDGPADRVDILAR
jgi:outer membrane protein OmpA-like peptidoglycan-associated protein